MMGVTGNKDFFIISLNFSDIMSEICSGANAIRRSAALKKVSSIVDSVKSFLVPN